MSKKAELNLIDKAVAFFNPKGAVDRLVARQKIKNFEYDAVKYNRERRGPPSLSGAEDYRSNYDRVELMKRARDLAENVGLVRSLLMKFASHVAANISYQARTQNPQANSEIEAYWSSWFDSCDLTGRHSGSTLMQVAIMSMLRDGDFLLAMVRADGDLKLQGIEADRLGDPYKVYTSLELIGGIHIDRNTGAPTAYDIYNRSIGDFYTYQATIAASQAFHLFDPLRIDQYRGITAFHTAINDQQDIREIENSEKIAAKYASMQAAVIRRNNNNPADLSTLTTDDNFDGQQIKLESVEAGKVSYLEPGEDIVFPDGPSRPSGAFAEFHKILLRNICMGLGIPYSFAVDPSAMSGPTARLEMQQAGRTFRRYQKLLEDKVLKPLKNVVIADGIARGLIQNRVGGQSTKGIFNFGANVSIDLGRDSSSAIAEFKTGLRTAADIYSERGLDFEGAMRQRAQEAKLIQDLAKEYGIPPTMISDVALVPAGADTVAESEAKAKEIISHSEEKDEGEEPKGGDEPEPVEPIEPSSENLEVKKKESELADNCGTGAGGFQPGNECAKGGGEGKKVIAYHGTSKEAAEKIEKYGYDMEKSTDGGMWLTPNKERIESKDVGAGQHGGIVARVIDESKLKLAGRKEYDRYVTDQLISMGYDGVKLPSEDGDAYKIFFPEKLSKVIEKSKEFESDCGTGAGGFQPGNTCAVGGDGKSKSVDKDYGLPLNNDGTVTVYHHTTKEKAQKIINTGILRSAGEPDVYVTSSKSKDIGYGDTIVPIKIDPKKLSLDDEFPDGRKDFRISVKKPGGQIAVKTDSALSSLTEKELKMLIAGMMGGIELGKYDGIDFTPPQGARDAAKRALDVREGKPASQKGMTPVGIARARDLMNGVKLSPDTVRRMKAFFDRHEVDKKGATWDEQGKGWQAWNGWGGDAGYAWARKMVRQMNSRDEEFSELARPGPKSAAQTPAPPKERIKGSKENPEGTAATRSKAGDIEISEANEQALKDKIAEFIKDHPQRKVPSLGTLKKVFRRGAGAFSTSFRPTISGGQPNSRNAWAMARVNKFLKMAGGGEVKESYRKADGDLLT